MQICVCKPLKSKVAHNLPIHKSNNIENDYIFLRVIIYHFTFRFLKYFGHIETFFVFFFINKNASNVLWFKMYLF